MPRIKRKYKPQLKAIDTVQEAQSKFSKYEEPTNIELSVANAYRLDISLGGIVAQGGEFLNIYQLDDGDELTEMFIDQEDSKNFGKQF